MNTIEVISRVVIKRDGLILLCKALQSGGHYYLPGGHVEFGDTTTETVYKELKEEMGLERDQITNLRYHDILENFWGEGEGKRHEINHIFSADISSEVTVTSMEDHIAFDWVDPSTLNEVRFMPSAMIEKIKNI